MFSRRESVTLRVREENSSPAEIAGCFAEIARSLDERPRKLLLTFDSTVRFVFDIDAKSGDYTIEANGEVHLFSLRRRWLPEHPVPLTVGPGRGGRPGIVRLKIDPASGNRFRVSDGHMARPIPVWFAFSVVSLAAVSALTLNPVVISAMGAAAAVWAAHSLKRRFGGRIRRRETPGGVV